MDVVVSSMSYCSNQQRKNYLPVVNRTGMIDSRLHFLRSTVEGSHQVQYHYSKLVALSFVLSSE